MTDDFDDHALMCSNLAKLGWSSAYALRVSKEHYTWLAMAPSLVRSIVHTAGGIVEGHPTSEINILQRIRQLVEIERTTAAHDGRVRLVDQRGTEVIGAGPACACCKQVPRLDCDNPACAFRERA